MPISDCGCAKEVRAKKEQNRTRFSQQEEFKKVFISFGDGTK